MRTITTTTLMLFIAFVIGPTLSCRHQAPEAAVSDPCLKTSIIVTGTVTNATSTTAANGSISVSATGASGFTYSLNNGPYQSTGVFSNLAVGSYAVIARSSLGCIGSAQFTVANGDPCAGVNITVTASVTNASSSTAADGSISATAIGGTGFQYKLNNGNFQSSSMFSGLAAGTYTVTAKTATGCMGSAQFAISAGNVCTSKNITVAAAVTNSDKCAPTGALTITATGSTGFSYQLNGGAFQSSNVFSNLAAGNYTITVKDADNCTRTTTTTLGTVSAGTLFSNVKTLLISQCKPCHINGGNNGGVNFDNDCDIVAKKDRIKVRCIDGIPSFMPPNGNLTTSEKQKIMDWFNAGGKYTN